MIARATPFKHLLLLAGSGESREIAAGLAGGDGLRITASLLHCPRSFGPLGVPTRIGGFGGAEAFCRFLTDQGVTAVLDATHPFAVRIGARASAICAKLGLPYARVLRPAWVPGPGDNWTEVANEAAARALLRPGQRVFTTTGRATLAALTRDRDAQFMVRRMAVSDPPEDMKNVTYIIGSGPFSVEQETDTLRRLKIGVLVVKNSGGVPSRTKLDAARALNLPVILIARPPQPDGAQLSTVAAALDWVRTL